MIVLSSVSLKRFDSKAYSKAYYLAHRSGILEYSKLWRESHRGVARKRGREGSKRWRDSHRELYNERQCVHSKRWRNSHRKVFRAIHFAQVCVPLGSCCEFCGSVDDLMRFHPDYDFPLIVVTVCRECRGWIRGWIIVF